MDEVEALCQIEHKYVCWLLMRVMVVAKYQCRVLHERRVGCGSHNQWDQHTQIWIYIVHVPCETDGVFDVWMSQSNHVYDHDAAHVDDHKIHSRRWKCGIAESWHNDIHHELKHQLDHSVCVCLFVVASQYHVSSHEHLVAFEHTCNQHVSQVHNRLDDHLWSLVAEYTQLVAELQWHIGHQQQQCEHDAALVELLVSGTGCLVERHKIV